MLTLQLPNYSTVALPSLFLTLYWFCAGTMQYWPVLALALLVWIFTLSPAFPARRMYSSSSKGEELRACSCSPGFKSTM